MPQQIDWARLAAFIDGEGSICILHSEDKTTSPGRIFFRDALYVSIANTDPRLPLWCQKTFGGRVWKSHQRKGYRPVLMWRIHATTAIKILKGCMRYFLIKKEQARIAIAWQGTRQTTTNQWGCKGVPPKIAAKRRALEAELKRLKHVSFSELRIKPSDFAPILKIEL